MGFCSCSIKYLLFLFNFLVVLCGLGLIALGVVAKSEYAPVSEDIDGATTGAVTIIVLGVIIFLIAFFGCCGAIRESSCMLITYAVILSVILIIEIGLGVLIFAYREEAVKNDSENWENMFKNYNADERQKDQVDTLQEAYKCCGPHGPSSWENGNFPPSCCQQKDVHLDQCIPYQQGCLEKTAEAMTNSLKTFGSVIIALGCIQVLGVISACFLASSIRNQERRGYV